MNKLKISFLGTEFDNPLILPSGIVQEISESLKGIDAGAGGVVTKSLTVKKREGNPLPRIIKYEHGHLNSVGLRNPGIDEGVNQIKKLLKKTKSPVIVSIFAASIEDFKILAGKIIAAEPKFIELNLSCPNTVDELGQPLGMGAESTYKTIKAVRKEVGKKFKLIAKLTPNVTNISEVAKAAEEASVNAISAINTVGPGMVIDLKTRKPVLGNKEGGVSGPGIKPIAVRCIYNIYQSVKIPIIGMGGVSNWQDAVEMMLAGATLVGVGSAVYQRGFKVFAEIKDGLLKYMESNHFRSLDSIIGKVH